MNLDEFVLDRGIRELKDKVEKERQQKPITIDAIFCKIREKLQKIPKEKRVDFIYHFLKRIDYKYVQFPRDANVRYVLVRILRNVPPFLGVDGIIYRNLKRNCIAYIPFENAKILVRNGDAEWVRV